MQTKYLKLQNWFIPFGMVSVLSFFAHTILGKILWRGYNPIQQSISELTADGAPNANLLRIFVIIYEMCLIVFILGMNCEAFKEPCKYVRTGYVLLLGTILLSIIGFNTFPMTVIFVISAQNLAHTLTTIVLLCSTILALVLISIGYIRNDKLIVVGRINFLSAIFPTIFNVVLWYSALSGGNNFGIIERLTVYPFHVFTFFTSWYYVRLQKTEKQLAGYRI